MHYCGTKPRVRTYESMIAHIMEWRRDTAFMCPDPIAEETCCILELMAADIMSNHDETTPTPGESRGLHTLWNAYGHVWDKAEKVA